jgi:hypothetical protein
MRVIEWGIGLVGYITYLQMKDELPNNTAAGNTNTDRPSIPESPPKAITGIM